MLPFRVVVVHEHHRDGNAEHNDAADNNLLLVVVIALDVLRVFFVEFLEGRALGKFRRVNSAICSSVMFNVLTRRLSHLFGVSAAAGIARNRARKTAKTRRFGELSDLVINSEFRNPNSELSIIPSRACQGSGSRGPGWPCRRTCAWSYPRGSP